MIRYSGWFFRIALPSVVLFAVAASARAQDMPLGEVLVDGQGWELVAEGYKFTEGPAVDAAGNVFFTDIPNNRILRIDASTGKVTTFAEDTFATNGLMFGPDGKLYGCQNGKGRLVAYDTIGKPTIIAEEVPSNDLVVDRDGGVFFTDPSNHRVWYLPPGGRPKVVDEGIERPNGLILLPDQGTLVVGDTLGKHLWAFRVGAGGKLTDKQPYYTTRTAYDSQKSGADGMTVDAAGRLYVATYAGLQMFDTQGRISGVILNPQQAFLSNACFGGPEFDMLYVTCSDKVYRRQTKTRGGLVYGAGGAEQGK